MKALKPNKLVAALCYVAVTFIFSAVITLLIAKFVAVNKSLDSALLIESFSIQVEELLKWENEYIEANILCQSLGNFIGYLLAFILVVFFMRDELIKDFKAIKENPRFFILFIPIVAVLGTAIAYGIDVLVGLLSGPSNNQSLIVLMITGNNGWMLIISTVLFAPVVEELIYRKIIFYYLKPANRIIAYVVSIVIFSLPHMLSTSVSSVGIGFWLLQLIPYASSGLLLCLSYDFGKENIYSSIAFHMLNNLFAVILVFI